MKKEHQFNPYRDLESRYGEPYLKYGKTFMRMNPSFFAGLILQENQLRFHANKWLVYNGRFWNEEDMVSASRRVMERLRRFAAEEEIPEILPLVNSKLATEILGVAKTMALQVAFPVMDWRLIPCQNTVLRWVPRGGTGRFVPEAFAPEQNIRSLLTVQYDENASYDDFKRNVLNEVVGEADAHLLQHYLGAALLSINLTENFLLLQGVGGSSKSLLVRILVEILGDERVFDINIKDLGQNFELSGLDGQTLLVASESAGDALCSTGSQFVKKMIGGDKLQAKLKYANKKRQLCGNYSLIVVTNEQTAFHYEGNGGEWQRRLLPVFFIKPHAKVIKGLALQLLAEYGSGILNWLLEGAADVLRNEWHIPLTPEQEMRRDRLIARSEPVRLFIEKFIERSVGDDFTSDESYRCYSAIAQESGLPILTREVFFKQLATRMAEAFPGAIGSNNLRRKEAGQEYRACRGYRGFRLKGDSHI